MPSTGHDVPGHPVIPMAPDTAPMEGADAFAERRATLRNGLQCARDWQALIAAGQAKGPEDIAVQQGVPPARVSQLLSLLNLAPEVLSRLEDPKLSGPVPTEQQLLRIAQIKTPGRQIRRFRAVLEETAVERAAKTPAAAKPHGKGLQYVFARAREIREMFESGKYKSLRKLGKALGLTGQRVGQLLNLTELAPDLVKRLDVPAQRLPKGFNELHLRTITNLRDHEEQRVRFSEILEELRRGGSRTRK